MRIRALLAYAMFFVSVFFMASNANSQLLAGASLSWEKDEFFAEKVFSFATSNANTYNLEPVAFGEENIMLKSAYKSQNTRAMYFAGEGERVAPYAIKSGAFPTRLDSCGCAITAGLAHKIFGSEDVIGQKIAVGAREYFVRGIMLDAGNFALITGEAGRKYSSLLLYGAAGGDLRTSSLHFARAAGLGAPFSTVCYNEVKSILDFLAVTPFMAIAFGLCCFAFSQRKRLAFPWDKLLILGFFVIIAIALPIIIKILPVNLVPASFASLDAWEEVFLDFYVRVQEFINSMPNVRLLQAKLLIINQITLAAAALMCYNDLLQKKIRN